MVKDLIILGSGGLTQEYAWLVEEINEDKKTFNLLGFLDDISERLGNEYIGYPVLGVVPDIDKFKGAVTIIGVGAPRARKAVFEKVAHLNPNWTNLISPTVRLHSSNDIGHWVMIGRYSDLTVGCRIGNHVMINIHVVLGHAVRVGDYSVISPNVTINGKATLGKVCYVGASAFVRDVTVGNGATIGANSAVVKDVRPNCVVAGVLARVLHSGAPSHTLTRYPEEKK